MTRKIPFNNGILGDDLVSNSCGTQIRRVRYRLPETEEAIEFLTNLSSKIPPDLIAQLYFMRWRIEKSFDEIKNKLCELKAWAASHKIQPMKRKRPNAKPPSKTKSKPAGMIFLN